MLLVFMFLMLVVLLISALYAMRRDAVVPTFRLQGTGLPPELTLKAGQRYHGFVSHAWSTAQAPCPMSRTTGPLCAPCRLTHTSEPQPRRRMPQPPSSGSFSECCPPSASFWVSHSTSPVARHPLSHATGCSSLLPQAELPPLAFVAHHQMWTTFEASTSWSNTWKRARTCSSS